MVEHASHDPEVMGSVQITVDWCWALFISFSSVHLEISPLSCGGATFLIVQKCALRGKTSLGNKLEIDKNGLA